MIRAILVGALAAMAPQEASLPIEELIRRLQDETPMVREDAAIQLVKRYDEAVPALRKLLPAASGEAWKLYDRALQRCEGERRRRFFLEPPPKISLSADPRPLHEVLQDFAKSTGYPLGQIRIPDRPVSFQIKDAPPLEVLNRLCWAARMSWRTQWAPEIPGRPPPAQNPSVIFWDMPPPTREPRVLYLKNYAVSVGGLHITRYRTPFQDEFNAYVGGVIQTSPLASEVQLDELTFDRIVDDRGKALYEAPTPDPARRGRTDRLDRSIPMGTISWSARIQIPDPEAKTVSVLGARAGLRFEIGRRHLALEASEKGVDQVVEYEGLKVRLSAFRKEGDVLNLKVVQQGRRTAVDDSNECRAVAGERLEYAELRLRDGSTVNPQGRPRQGGKGGEWEYTFMTSGEPVELRFVTYTLWAIDALEFEFKDLPIPN